MGRPRKNPHRLNSLVDEFVFDAVTTLVRRRARTQQLDERTVLRTLLEECISLHPTLAPAIAFLRTEASATHLDGSSETPLPGDLDVEELLR